jgi:transcription-repair coupling factor (superfamily II helicase)
VELPDSAQLRLRRLHPKAQYKPASKLVTVPKPVDGGRIGGAPLRDVALLEWCTKLLTDLLAPARQPTKV